MKITRNAILMTLFALALVACSTTADSGAAQASASTPMPVGTTFDGAAVPISLDASPLSGEAQWIVGLFKLEGTDQAITSQQAAVLLPICETMKEAQSKAMPQGAGQPASTPDPNAAAQQDNAALVKQITDALTAGQVEAIQKMSLTRQDMAAVMQQQGITMQGGQPGNGGPQGNGTMPAPRGTLPAGGPGGNQPQQAPQIGTPQPGAGRPWGGMTPAGLLDALIQLLQKRAAS